MLSAKGLGAAIAIAVAVAVAGPASSSAADRTPLLPDCGNVFYGGKISPVAWSSGCLGGSVNLDRLSWQGWGAATAVATGVIRYNTCEPSCASGGIYDYPAELRVDGIARCASPLGPRPYYTRFVVTVDFPEDNVADRPPGRLAILTYEARCPTPGYLVATRGRAARFGAFAENGPYDGDSLERSFGPPSRRDRDRYGCVKRWRKLGLRVQLALYGGEGNACSEGIFISAVMTGRRWHTRSGVRPGSRASRAARSRTRRCTPRACRGMRGFVFGLHRSGCALGRYPNVIAETKAGRVKRLLVYSHSCE